MNEDQLYAFAFKGWLTQHNLDATGLLRRLPSNSFSDEQIEKRLAIDLLDENLVRKARRMAAVYAAIAAFENSVREFVQKVLLEEKGENWWDEAVSEKIRKRANTRMEEEEKILWHTQRGTSPINYTEFGDLSSIMIQNWELFEPHIQSHEWMKQIIKTIERSRNVIMHSGELGNEDVERIGTLIRDWLRQVGG